MTRAYIAALAAVIGMTVAVGHAHARMGISVNGISVNGISVNGISVNGTTSAKLKLKAVVLPDGSMVK